MGASPARHVFVAGHISALVPEILRRFSATLETNDRGTTKPVEAIDVHAADSREAAKTAARHWQLRPHEWCFEHSPYDIAVTETDETERVEPDEDDLDPEEAARLEEEEFWD